MYARTLRVLITVSTLLLFSACANTLRRGDTVDDRYAAQADYPVQFGHVSQIELSRTDGRTSGGGAVIGAVLGAVVGNQIGKGSGRSVATGVGLVGGAVIGNQIEQRQSDGMRIYRISVRLENGRTRQFDYDNADSLRVGDRVRVENGQLYHD
ncbi:glycine zipper 2TM domain-containing protein [Chitinimonas sp. BJYL2]|uniref:glycine zipper 2TM domain-containing protein n=1 Tax=Chitinimonas sp. BJYL2 TaxID=2976696 RepID=UPI0022B3A8ED|nr:glycine zipper 2TM domain-containing protein [Chitinimonas sp. BJYL2]